MQNYTRFKIKKTKTRKRSCVQEYHGGRAPSDDDDVKDGMSVMRRSCEGLLHLHDALGQVGRDLRQAFTAAVHDVVVAGAAGRTHGHLGGTSPGLRLNWTWRHTSGGEIHRSQSENIQHLFRRTFVAHFGISYARQRLDS